jgi:hypothetical protein
VIGHRLRIEQRSDAYGQDMTVEGICVGVHTTSGSWENPILIALRLDDNQLIVRRWANAKVFDLGYSAKHWPPYAVVPYSVEPDART